MDKYSIIKKRKYSYICKNDGQHHCGECNNIPGYATFIDKVLNTKQNKLKNMKMKKSGKVKNYNIYNLFSNIEVSKKEVELYEKILNYEKKENNNTEKEKINKE